MARPISELDAKMPPESLLYALRLGEARLEEIDKRTSEEEKRLRSPGVSAALIELDARARARVKDLYPADA